MIIVLLTGYWHCKTADLGRWKHNFTVLIILLLSGCCRRVPVHLRLYGDAMMLYGKLIGSEQTACGSSFDMIIDIIIIIRITM